MRNESSFVWFTRAVKLLCDHFELARHPIRVDFALYEPDRPRGRCMNDVLRSKSRLRAESSPFASLQ
jgi:hypothetical protein